jgi:hypothetical protein
MNSICKLSGFPSPIYSFKENDSSFNSISVLIGRMIKEDYNLIGVDLVNKMTQ